MTHRKLSVTFLILALGVTFANAKTPKFEQDHQLTPEQAALVQRAIDQEKVLIRSIQQRTPLVESYIQDIRQDAKLDQAPVDDQYMLSRVDFRKGFSNKAYEPKEAAKHSSFKNSLASLTGLGKVLGDEKFAYNPTGFMEMMFIDPSGFDMHHYDFAFVRREFLGSVTTSVFDVHPKADVRGYGRFHGRIWVEEQAANVVRFNGTYTGPASADASKYFFHFDSWRMNVQPGIWLPVAVFVKEAQRTEADKSIGLKAQTYFWGYSLNQPARASENVSIKVDAAVDKSSDSPDVSPLQTSRIWVAQAENNVIDRLVAAGLVAPLDSDGYERKVLDPIAVNLALSNNLAIADQIHTRVLLTSTIEATTVGNTILLSKGLIDSLPSEEAIASVVAMELAHVEMGHHIDTSYAFNDRMLFPDETTFQHINMNHSDVDNAAAASKALEYLRNSTYKDRLANAGLYYEQLADRAVVLKALNTPLLGDSLLKADGTPWMSDLTHMAPKLNWDDLAQTAALPLGSSLKIDPWDDKVQLVNSKHEAPLNAGDKMPFEVIPISIKLQRYETAIAPPQPVPAAPIHVPKPAASVALNPDGQPGIE